MSLASERFGFSIPACAWKRPFGDAPEEAEKVQLTGEIFATKNRTIKGMPLGGIGAGTFMYNICGTFGPWYMKPGRYEERFLKQAAFHVREQTGDEPPHARTLATRDVMPAWETLDVGDGAYYALFPRGWTVFEAFDVDVSMQFFSPIIKDNYRETSYPAAVFLFQLENNTETDANLSVMFTFPNAPYTGPHNLNQDTVELQHRLERLALHEKERKGLFNEAVVDKERDVTAIVMGAHHPQNPEETQDTQWCIASTGSASYISSWDGAGDGGDIWDAFTQHGALGDGALADDALRPAGALAQTVSLAPGERVIIPFVLTWDFPLIEFGSGTRWWRRYTEYFATEPGNAFEIAAEALGHYEKWLEKILAWTQPIAANPAYPDWLKQGALNELYYTTFGGSFWENGCATKPKTFGARKGQHLCGVMECQEYPFLETFDVRHHAARSFRDLWPQIERDILLADADFILDTPDGSAPHDVGSPHNDPFFSYDAYSLFARDEPLGAGTGEARTTTPWSEFSPKFIQQAFAYWHQSGDDDFLEEIWDAAVRTFHYQISTDTDGDGITEMMSSEYADNKFFNAVLWIGALEMMLVMAEKMNDEETRRIAVQQLKKARATVESTFWNEELGYYQFNATCTDIMGDAFIGQRYVDVTGLPPTVDPERMVSHYRQALRIAASLTDTDGDGIGNLGMGNVLTSDGEAGHVNSISRHEKEVWVGVSYVLAANIYHQGKRLQDGALQAGALMLAWGVYQQTWRNDATGYWFNTPEAWDIDDPTRGRAPMYQRARGIWELLMEVHNPYR
jgi:uncharacterized protein (DUF608 family)